MKAEKSQSLSSAICMKFIERFGTQLVTVILNIILARLLMPEDYGTLSILNVFVVLAQVITQNGISNALVQKTSINDIDYSTGFAISIGFSGGLYLILFFAAPAISTFYENSNLSIYLRVLALILFPGAVNAIYNAIIMRKMQFRIVMITGIISNISACIIGVILAYWGLGVWSLIIQQMVSCIISSCILGFFVHWKISLRFSFKSAKQILRFGGAVTIASILDNLYYDAEGLIIGKLMSNSLLGIYTNARTYPLRVLSSVKDTIAGVIFPAMSRFSSDKNELRNITCFSIRLFSFIVFPAMIGMALVAKEFIIVFLTERWIGCLYPMRMFCIAFSFLAISSPNIQLVKAVGNGKLVLKIEIVRKSIIIIFLVITSLYFRTINAISVGFMISNVATALAVAARAGKEINYTLFEQIKDLWKTFFSILMMTIAILFFDNIFSDSNFQLGKLISKVFIGGGVYILSSLIIKNPVLLMIIKKIKKTNLDRLGKYK